MKPRTRTIHGEEHTLVLIKVAGRDKSGRPKEATVLYDEDVELLKGGEEYVTAWVPSVTVKKRTN